MEKGLYDANTTSYEYETFFELNNIFWRLQILFLLN